MLFRSILLLSRLTLSPDICPNTSNKLLRVCNSSSQVLEKKMVSSTNCKWDTLVLFLPTLKPSNRLLYFALNIILLDTLATIVNRKRDRGSPYLNPLVALTHPLAFPFTRIVKETEDKQPFIQVLHLGLNPFFSNT